MAELNKLVIRRKEIMEKYGRPIRVLELFAGTGSVGKVCRKKGYEVISLDLQGADINVNIMDWDYTAAFPVGHFDIIWGSPPCHSFSNLRRCWIGRKLKEHNGAVCSAELLDEDMYRKGLPILRRTQEIIDYFKPKYWFMENPQTGRMKDFLKDVPYYDADYCKYSDWGYKKRTRFWTNMDLDHDPLKLCCKDCENMAVGGTRHTGGVCKGTSLRERYRIPPKLIRHLFRYADFEEE